MGTPRELLTEQGRTAWAGRMSTWGQSWQWQLAANDRDKLSCNLRFAGQYEDEESGLHYNRHRYYDNETAQYLTPDPIGLAGGVNPYGYVHNPLSWVDPLGLACCLLPNGQTVADFEKSLANLPANERVPVVRNMAESVANNNGWTRAKNIESKNRGRVIYQGDKYYYSIDTQHGRFEQLNKKNGKHMGEINMGKGSIPASIDNSGGHDLVIK